MTKHALRTLLATSLGFAAVTLAGTRLFAAPGSETRRPPNFVLVLGEGHGWASLSVPMDDAVPNSKSSFVRTPHFEKLAQAGMRFAKDELKVADNTYVIFTTDHGTPGRNPPLSGGKGTIWEGGLRVPLIVRGPGIKPGACCHVRTVGVDLFPTIAQLAHVTAPQRAGLEGGSLVPLLLGGGSGVVQRPREEYVVHFPHYDKDSLGPASSILWGDDKLIRVYETGQRLLFNLAQDPGERRDLAGQMPDKVQELDARLTQYLESVHAQLPTVNAKFVPGTEPQTKPDTFRTDVPDHPLDIILGRPTQNSITLSVLVYRDLEGYIAYGTQEGKCTSETPPRTFPKGQPVEVVLASLTANTRYYYQFRSRDSGAAPFRATADGTFHTARPPGSPFTFTITADPHLDEHTDPALYRQTLTNALADAPDFHIDLGDTFMSEKHPGRETAARQYLAQRFYFGLIGRSAPLFLVLGNHDGEGSRWHDGTADSLAVWSNTMRKRYFPNPFPDKFYSGNEAQEPFTGLLQDYYAWQWGDALFIVLDPFWYTPRPRGSDDNWNRTLGATQYRWLQQTLERSRAAFKFVFVHHLVGGADKSGRGGVEAAPFYEWGGCNADRTDGFREQRPDWPLPIHQLLVQHRVAAVFHGHDHLYVKQDLDGIVYQEVPQPGAPGWKNTRTAAEYGYVNGVILGSSGHLRVRVGPAETTVDYVRSCLPEDERSDRRNAAVGHTYTMGGPPMRRSP